MLNWKRLIPNAVTAARFGFSLIFPFAAEAWWLPLILVSAVSDFLDGWLARRWRTSTWQGGIFDAVADKTFTITVFATFAVSARFPWWWLPLLLQREIVVGLVALYLASRRHWSTFREMPSRPAGKVATAGQFLLAIAVPVAPELSSCFLVPVVLLGSLAAGDYWLVFRRGLRQRKAAAGRISP
ncbi:CDP-alcohol phosphatidyltransferase family protein [Desulfoprunum benzoelyticum]|uniref:Phosphatidylglycerophosphate synthase n=1 Tax=Desulfoprunum benzoelyticum TaxID=1506996 RepID=A0A840UQQ4_9BACT|nr:CDP-alcohol phosphatidyltransferase family protein [Desulfoprunum benzoelyticum]MBB5348122.1 phosphatidylglycerophosphate synthase [Desulfoprunum benzoelyticum]MBM9530267.1 CDP-alcohol phosphatidyltransferase family protein [Desulfoprunum benzoelyticum]